MHYHPSKFPKIPASEITPEAVFETRRSFLKKSAALLPITLLPGTLSWASAYNPAPSKIYKAGDLKITDEELALNYTNFYEFGLSKEKNPSVYSKFKTSPWQVKCGGLAENPMTLDAAELRDMFSNEERVYRFRCVEAWSAVIPWAGYPLRRLIEKMKPKKEAKYVIFKSFLNKEAAPGQSSLNYPWPYREGLRLDEAMNDLTLLTFGMYGKPLSPANGAPIRLVVPWKYGFKSIKSVVSIELSATQPETTWNKLAADEYGFFANVNPDVDHPRWSQKTEKPLGGSLTNLFSKQKTLPFNGYAEQI
ncbi:hypothetical protein CHS0354_030082 [Potamilus streckersoni]|uniref:Oxidoreductase molybdopterin-binding domain-containing protein n=1 Tax=Potamilus streckersoni TaxID=2493646 RepID=A0AAE0RLU7_9BIVA|nr:hypothetical protein CHS0354_030082 [Potamilus streckersoni]